MYIPLHWWSTFSFLEAIGKPKDIVKKAKELGFPAIALTDLNVVYWLIQFYQAAKAEEIKPILWVEIWFVMDVNAISNVKNIGSLCLLAKNDQWYLNLLKLVTYASQEGVMRRPKIDFQVLQQYKDWILCFMWWENSWMAAMMENSENEDRIKEIFDMLIQILWKENCFLEIIAQDESENSKIKAMNQFVLSLSKEKNIPCLVSNMYRYLTQKDKTTHELAMAIKDNMTIFDANHRVLTTENHMMVDDEIRFICQKNGYTKDQIDEWISNTKVVADLCNANIEMWQKLFPKYEVEEDIAELYDKYKNDLILEE